MFNGKREEMPRPALFQIMISTSRPFRGGGRQKDEVTPQRAGTRAMMKENPTGKSRVSWANIPLKRKCLVKEENGQKGGAGGQRNC